MGSVRIRNNHSTQRSIFRPAAEDNTPATPITLEADGGEEVLDAKEWDAIVKRSPVVRAWLEDGSLEVGKGGSSKFSGDTGSGDTSKEDPTFDELSGGKVGESLAAAGISKTDVADLDVETAEDLGILLALDGIGKKLAPKLIAAAKAEVPNPGDGSGDENKSE